MILSVSRRTDIPAFYSDWFYNRVKAGVVYVRNPMNIHHISKINISPNVIDCIVFWTKDPRNMMRRMEELHDYNYYFQFTINPYGQEIEVNVPRKHGIIDAFKCLSDKIGSEKVIWRYDPILLSDKINIEYHIRYFEEIAKRLYSFTNQCIISFVDNYKKIEQNMTRIGTKGINDENIKYISKLVMEIASSYNIKVQTCSERIDLSEMGITHGGCIDKSLIEDVIGYSINAKKDKSQRPECCCIESIDIGEYNTCSHGCLYCYANFNYAQVLQKNAIHDPTSPLLIGNVTEKDLIKERNIFSNRTPDLFG
jgi:DNA repair photolyase